MRVTVRLAEPYWRPVGKRDLELDLSEGARVSDLLARLRQEHPALAAEMRHSPPHIFLEDAEADAASPLTEGGRVHLVWPVAGG